jgi:hypothetical protein
MATDKPTTNILGYFNPNSYPLLIDVSALNLRMTLAPKQQLIINGQRVNDPVLHQLCRPKGLAVEMAKGPVALVALQRPTPASPTPGFSGQVTKPVAAEQNLAQRPVPKAVSAEEGVKMRPPTNPVSSQFTTSGNPITGMSMEEARKRGLVQQARMPKEGPDDKGGSPLRGEQIPELGFAVDPKLAKHLQRKSGTMEEQAQTIQRSVAEEPVDAPAVEGPDVDLGQLTAKMLHENQPASLAEPVVETPPESPASVPVEGAQSGPVIPPEISALLDSAQANLETQPAPSAPETQPQPFECPFDGKKFAFRSWLIRHVRQKYPDKVAEVEALYPKTKE